jgi:hypothetical protein
MATINRAVRMTIFDRRAATDLMLDSSATGDAVLLVATVHVLITLVGMVLLGGFGLIALLAAAIYGVAGWLILSFAIWIMGTKLLGGSGEVQTLMRVTGFASLPLLLALVGWGWVGTLWQLAILVVATMVVLGQEIKEAVGSVVLGAALVLLIQLVFRAPLLLL